MRAVLAGGGSAGHISPAIALAQALRRAEPDVELTFLGTQEGLEARLVPEAGYRLEFIPRVPLPRVLTPRLLTVPGRLAGAVRAAGHVLEQVGADVVVGFGGYVAMPAYLAARRQNIPVVVHEQNARPGIANRFAARAITKHIAVSFPGTPLRHADCVGLPIRREIASLDRAGKRDEAAVYFGLDAQLPTVLVTGGSQGARRINGAVSGAAAAFAAAGVQVLHAYGQLNDPPELPDDTGGTSGARYVAVPYLDRMDLALAVADLAVSRAGANTVTEHAAVGLPSVYVPYPGAGVHQRFNAAPLVEAGGGLLVDDEELTSEWVKQQVIPLATDKDRLAAMSDIARSLLPGDADERLGDLVRKVAREVVRR